MALTANLLTIELVHRLLVVFYEVWFTHQGGTPGKRTMGLKILSCTKCLPVGMFKQYRFMYTSLSFNLSLMKCLFLNVLQGKTEFLSNLQQK